MSMTPVECPTCYSRVILSDEGRCPACSRLPNDPLADPSRTKVIVWEGLDLPPLCLGCGAPTRSLMTLRRTSCSEAARYGRIILGTLALPFVIPIGIIFPSVGFLSSLFLDPLLRQGVFSVVRVRISCCESCKARKLPKCDWIDFQEGTMALIVPKIVAEHVPRR